MTLSLRRIQMSVADRWFHYVTAPWAMRGIARSDTVIDCGANIGVYTEMLARKGATVHAFEPHPEAFRELQSRTSKFRNVHCHNQAVSNANGHMRLYLKADDKSIGATQSASLMPQKDNISIVDFVDVEVIRLSEFVQTIGAVRFLKMDIEGAEYLVLPDLIQTGAYRNIESIHVETHERSPGLRPLHDDLLAMLRSYQVKNIDLGWH